MQFSVLKDRLNFILNNDDTQTHPAFSATRLRHALNWAYRDEVRKARLEGGHDWFFTRTSITWPANQATLTLPPSVRQQDIQWFMDITNNDPGSVLEVSYSSNPSALHWRDRSTLQWGTSGPGSARTLAIGYYASPADMVEDEDEPDILPPDFHELIVWSAAIFLTEIADRSVPGYWIGEQKEMRMDMHKLMSKPRPGTKLNKPQGGPGGGTFLSNPFTAADTSAGGGLTDVD